MLKVKAKSMATEWEKGQEGDDRWANIATRVKGRTKRECKEMAKVLRSMQGQGEGQDDGGTAASSLAEKAAIFAGGDDDDLSDLDDDEEE